MDGQETTAAECRTLQIENTGTSLSREQKREDKMNGKIQRIVRNDGGIKRTITETRKTLKMN